MTTLQNTTAALLSEKEVSVIITLLTEDVAAHIFNKIAKKVPMDMATAPVFKQRVMEMAHASMTTRIEKVAFPLEQNEIDDLVRLETNRITSNLKVEGIMNLWNASMAQTQQQTQELPVQHIYKGSDGEQALSSREVYTWLSQDAVIELLEGEGTSEEHPKFDDVVSQTLRHGAVKNVVRDYVAQHFDNMPTTQANGLNIGVTFTEDEYNTHADAVLELLRNNNRAMDVIVGNASLLKGVMEEVAATVTEEQAPVVPAVEEQTTNTNTMEESQMTNTNTFTKDQVAQIASIVEGVMAPVLAAQQQVQATNSANMEALAQSMIQMQQLMAGMAQQQVQATSIVTAPVQNAPAAPVLDQVTQAAREATQTTINATKTVANKAIELSEGALEQLRAMAGGDESKFQQLKASALGHYETTMTRTAEIVAEAGHGGVDLLTSTVESIVNFSQQTIVGATNFTADTLRNANATAGNIGHSAVDATAKGINGMGQVFNK